ncbi:MAG: glycosyltransferase, partial [Rhodobacterales bacterium]|nr:glycosyltransferase [Rhodobacterales bacterium]
HYFYPDGVAAVRLGALLDRPVVITARGTDLNVLPDFPGPRRQIIDAARRAAGLVTVSAALRDRLADLGIPADRVRVLRNGVDMARFHPGDREDRRRRFGLDGPTVVSVGNLVPLKGHDLVIRALADLPPDTRLLIAGDGPERAALEGLAGSLGLAGRVTLMGRVAPADMPALYGAADVLVLASSREGLPNVLLEALASGTPVVSTRVGGTPEVVTAPQAGRLVADRTPQALAAALADVLHAPPDRAATRAFAERFGWAATTGGQIALFQEILNGNRAFGDQKGTPQGLETPPKAE